MPRARIVARATGAAEIDIDHVCNDVMVLEQMTVKFDSAPTESESITVIKDAVGGAVYDTRLYEYNPSGDTETDVLWQPTRPITFLKGDIVRVDFANTDENTYGVEIIMRPAD